MEKCWIIPGTIIKLRVQTKNQNCCTFLKNKLLFFQVFQVVANMLELFNASVNFYLYCICNKDIRSHFLNILISTCQKWKNGSKEIDGCQEENLSSTKQRNSSVSSDFFHRIRKNSTLFLPWAKVNPRDSLTGTTNTDIPEK